VTDDETRVLAPAALQEALDSLTAGVEGGRCFVRPSGTEDAVRIYAEAASQPLADALALGAARAVHALAGGVGASPDGFAA
jgi:phosphoacetylglucosamine mutase